MKTIASILVVIAFTCYGCHQKRSLPKIEVFYQNHTIECISSPSWESVINGEHPEYLEKIILVDNIVYDSVVKQIKELVPMKAGSIPDDCRTDMQCVIHYTNSQKADTLLIGDWCISLNGIIMKDNDVLVQLIRRHSGYYHQPIKSL